MEEGGIIGWVSLGFSFGRFLGFSFGWIRWFLGWCYERLLGFFLRVASFLVFVSGQLVNYVVYLFFFLCLWGWGHIVYEALMHFFIGASFFNEIFTLPVKKIMHSSWYMKVYWYLWQITLHDKYIHRFSWSINLQPNVSVHVVAIYVNLMIDLFLETLIQRI